ncbi:uncharacterized protein LOC128221205 [Mya arenaria]|uniref:uncharacterized protein LOC128221205 n=1 Tax=Mya arenaria TaxID=6604 RepID=UPI0022E3670A|nr:uncharacterized protein LOC128221205 [Mya arenaria]
MACSLCANRTRVLNVSQLEKGQHISMPGKYGKLYEHHAIVIDVKSTSGTQVLLELIHFRRDEKDKIIKITKNEQTYDLGFNQLYITQYGHRRHSRKDIVKRADTIMCDYKQSKFKKYNFLQLNCEHFATWCVNGKEECFQVQKCLDFLVKVTTAVFGGSSRVVRALLKLLIMSTDKLAAFLSYAVPEISIGANACVYLLYCIANTIYVYWNYRTKNVCRACLKRKLKEMWLNFGVFVGLAALQFVIYTFALSSIGPIIGNPLIAVVVLLFIALQVAVIKIIRVLRNPFQVKKRKIKTPLQLRVADIVAFRYYGLEHVAIISDITDVNEGSRSARVKCIHYGLRHLFAKREIVDEDFEMNLAVSSWHVYDVNGPHTYSRDERLSRARKRVGEKRWKITNRSDFLCHWATIKTTNEDDIFSEVHTDEKLPAGKKAITNTRNDNEENMPVDLLNTTPVCIAEELRLGDVVTFKNEKGILVKKKTTDDQQKEVLIYLIIPEYPIVKRIKYTVDLNTNDIYVLHYHPARCIPMQERVKRALFLEKKNVCPFMPVMHS